MPHFIRGYFDGDGSITTRHTKYGDYQQISITCGSDDFTNGLNNYLKDIGFSSNIYDDSKSRDNNNKYIKISKKDNISKFYKMIYGNDDIGEFYLKRKRDKFIYK
ncbi:MAG: LAGLIDADG family homing endonuclease [Psychrobacillus sp.]